MKLEITLAPNGSLRLILPTGRFLDLGHEASALHFIRRILQDKVEGKKYQRGYVGDFPTQHVIEIWKKEAKRAAYEAAKEEAALKGINLAELEFKL